MRRRLRCFGWVQGVGFRYRARHAADMLGVTGWVRNEEDGSVTLELQGTDEQIDRVIDMIDHGRYVRIEHMEARSVPLQVDESGFRVRGDRW